MTNQYERASRNAGDAASSQVARAFEAGTATSEEMRQTGEESASSREGSDIAGQVKGRAEETATKPIETGARKMEKSAGTICDKVSGEGGVRESAGMAVADRMEQSAEYLRERDTGRMMANAGKFVREHPMLSVAVAVVVGFMIGRRLP